MTDVSTAPRLGLDRAGVAPAFVARHGKGLGSIVVLMALLPLPFTLLRVLPLYDMHARFLVFYAPFICLLTVGYFLYVRDVLARVLFKHLLEPSPEPDPYRRPGFAGAARQAGTRLRVALLAAVPIALVAGSFYCVTTYIDRLQESVTIVGSQMLDRMPDRERRQFLTSAMPPAAGTAPTDAPPSTDPPAVPRATVGGMPKETVDWGALRRYTLRVADLEDVALFKQLTTLYIGAFVCAIGAAMLMLLKEHAREVLGLTEEGLLLGAEPDTID